MPSRGTPCRKKPGTAQKASEPDARQICREQAAKVLRRLPKIVDSIIEKAEAGSYLHASFLFEFAGIAPAPPEEASEPSLAALLFERLGLEPAPDIGSPPAAARR